VNKKENTNKTLLEITIRPETAIYAPIVNKYQVKRMIEKGYFKHLDDPEDAQHLDRVFPRTSEGLPFLYKLWLEAPLKRAIEIVAKDEADRMNLRTASTKWHIVYSIVKGRKIPTRDYVIIDGQPIILKRAIKLANNKKGEKQTMENSEILDSTFEIKFIAETKYPKEFIRLWSAATQIGLMARTGKGAGKFTVSIKSLE